MTASLAFRGCPAVYHVPVLPDLAARLISSATTGDYDSVVHDEIRDYRCLLYYGHDGPHRTRIDGNTAVWQ